MENSEEISKEQLNLAKAILNRHGFDVVRQYKTYKPQFSSEEFQKYLEDNAKYDINKD